MIPVEPDPIASGEQADPSGVGLRTAGDLAPYLGQPEVWLTGHAAVPPRFSQPSLRVQLAVVREGAVRIDKQLDLDVAGSPPSVHIAGMGPIAAAWPLRRKWLEGARSPCPAGTGARSSGRAPLGILPDLAARPAPRDAARGRVAGARRHGRGASAVAHPASRSVGRSAPLPAGASGATRGRGHRGRRRHAPGRRRSADLLDPLAGTRAGRDGAGIAARRGWPPAAGTAGPLGGSVSAAAHRRRARGPARRDGGSVQRSRATARVRTRDAVREGAPAVRRGGPLGRDG